MTGEYTLLISNLGPNDVNIDGIFGFIPFVGGYQDLEYSVYMLFEYHCLVLFTIARILR